MCKFAKKKVAKTGQNCAFSRLKSTPAYVVVTNISYEYSVSLLFSILVVFSGLSILLLWSTVCIFKQQQVGVGWQSAVICRSKHTLTSTVTHLTACLVFSILQFQLLVYCDYYLLASHSSIQSTSTFHSVGLQLLQFQCLF